jgi:hypothetical protein
MLLFPVTNLYFGSDYNYFRVALGVKPLGNLLGTASDA